MRVPYTNKQALSFAKDACKRIFITTFNADVAELADALVLGTSGVTRGGSTPSIRTMYHSNLPLGGTCLEPELRSNEWFRTNFRVHDKPFYFAG